MPEYDDNFLNGKLLLFFCAGYNSSVDMYYLACRNSNVVCGVEDIYEGMDLVCAVRTNIQLGSPDLYV